MKYWRIWAKALGEKATDNADSVAFVRTLLITQAIITNILISINYLMKKIWWRAMDFILMKIFTKFGQMKYLIL